MKQSFINRQKRQAQQRASQREREAGYHMFYAVQEISAEEYEIYRVYTSAFKLGKKFYLVLHAQINDRSFDFRARSQGWGDYKVWYVVGMRTPLKKGTFVD